MFIGHFGLGLGAKKFAPKISLGFLFIAVQFLDLLWPTLLLLNLEHVVISPGITKATPLDFVHYPISHSLVMVIAWGIIFMVCSWLFFKNVKYSFVIFLCVISHWFLDLIVHRPDLPLLPGNPMRLGFGLWNYPLLSNVIEAGVFFGGVFLYCKSTFAKTKFGKYGLVSLVVLLLFVQIANMMGPPPPNINAIAWAGQLQWLFVILAFYVDKNRGAINK